MVYRNLAAGLKLLSINKAMEVSGTKPTGYPTLAIANARAKWCWFIRDAGRIEDPDRTWNHPASAFFSDYAVNPGWNERNVYKQSRSNNNFRFLSRFFPVRMTEERITARVPIVPPKILAKVKGFLGDYCILWEADWQRAPKDPLLLKRITREWYSIEAEWDLTSIERLVLEMAAFQGE